MASRKLTFRLTFDGDCFLTFKIFLLYFSCNVVFSYYTTLMMMMMMRMMMMQNYLHGLYTQSEPSVISGLCVLVLWLIFSHISLRQLKLAVHQYFCVAQYRVPWRRSYYGVYVKNGCRFLLYGFGVCSFSKRNIQSLDFTVNRVL